MADYWLAGASKIDCVDAAYQFATALGLCRNRGDSEDYAAAKLGRPRKFDDDIVQRVLSTAFADPREPPND